MREDTAIKKILLGLFEGFLNIILMWTLGKVAMYYNIHYLVGFVTAIIIYAIGRKIYFNMKLKKKN